MKTVALVLVPGVQSLDVSGPMDVFAEANDYVKPGAGYKLVTVGTAPSIRASNGQLLGTDFDLSNAGIDYDVVLAAGGPKIPKDENDPALSAWLNAVAKSVPRYGSICNGAFLLGRAGLLDDKNVTTHWSDIAQLNQQFPMARIQEDRIHMRDGGLITSAGVTAGIDLALALVAEDHGPAISLTVAKRLLVVAQRQGGQSQFSPYLQSSAAPESLASRVQSFVMNHLADNLSVELLADVVCMSSRHFSRQFAKEVGVPPAEFVQRARIDAARNLLEGTDLAVKTVAYRCGFGSAARLRLVFSQRFGVTPNQYRDSFHMNRVPSPPSAARAKLLL
ncbi:helix-turn-helix domain-containing protein [Duganella sp. FT135W]|uniref:Helix-turn-helix domain-containing protein n=1 Tax=Duganella flavida TaxID=2692175 RepID=A0A6L8K3V5_9BURK|nr:GlxA family transcriptional regulator [Duganella flavida]MYM22146.1 helix-turn-helix domain-containing protein [Duganella flavida]